MATPAPMTTPEEPMATPEEPMAADPMATPEEPTATEEPTAADPMATTEEPMVADPMATPEEPMATAEPTAADPMATPEEPTATEEPMAADPMATREESMATAEPMATPEEPMVTAEPMVLMEMEPNNTILSANDIQLDSSSPVVVFGEIQDDLDSLMSKNDVDLFAVELIAEDTLLANIDAEIDGSSLDPVLSVFDINGNLLAQNDDNSFVDGGVTVGRLILGGVTVTEPDSFQQFTAPEDGTYYIGVSSSPNLNYDPTVAGSGIGDSSGTYSLELSFADEAREDTMEM